ncbi:MAG: hypothetical protein FWD11_08980, partial [Micrococcales bacterium]|nr:hypothetical protein [Micrococcales bacterium]
MRWLVRWRPVLRLAVRDALRHRARTLLAVVLVSLPIAWLVSDTSLAASVPTDRDVALSTIPDGAQAVVTATPLRRSGMPLAQSPEGATLGDWSDDGTHLPASADELARLLPPGNQVLEYWISPQLLATTGIDLAPGRESSAGEHLVEDVDVAALSTAWLSEAGPEALTVLLPTIKAGTAPTDNTQVVVTKALADHLGLGVGDQVVFVVPHYVMASWGTGRIGELMQDSQRGYRVVGIAEGDEPEAWALDGWIAAATAADPKGIPSLWLVVGPEPVTWDQTKAVNYLQALVVSRHVLTHYPEASELYPTRKDDVEVLQGVLKAVLAVGLGALLVLALVTPAFTVSVDQSRRTLGLAAAAGAAPGDLRRTITAQGLVIGLAGGVLGSVLGAVVTVVTPVSSVLDISGNPAKHAGVIDLGVRFPWWIFPVAVIAAVVVGVVATATAARTAARLHPVDALKDRRTPQTRRRGYLGLAMGPVLLAAGVG